MTMPLYALLQIQPEEAYGGNVYVAFEHVESIRPEGIRGSVVRMVSGDEWTVTEEEPDQIVRRMGEVQWPQFSSQS